MRDGITGLSGAGGAKSERLSPQGMPLWLLLQGDDSAKHDVHSGQNLLTPKAMLQLWLGLS